MTDDRLVLDLDAFYLEHRRCGDLETGLTETEAARVWLACSCGARLDRVILVAHSPRDDIDAPPGEPTECRFEFYGLG